jgi:hypothetical protein
MAQAKSAPSRRAVAFDTVRETAMEAAGIGGNYVTAEMRHKWCDDRTELYLFGAKRQPEHAFGDRVVFAIHPDIDVKIEDAYLLPLSVTNNDGSVNAGRIELAKSIAAATQRTGTVVGPLYLVEVKTRGGQTAWDFAASPDEAPDAELPFS